MSGSPIATRQAYRAASWVTAVLAFVAAVLAFAFGLAALTGPGSPAGDGQRVTTGPGPTGPKVEVLAQDQAMISGSATKVVGTKIDAPPLTIPLTMTVLRGGGTKAEFSGGNVAGKGAAVTWDGGRPLPIRGTGSIDFNGAVDVEFTPAGANWSLDGRARLLTPGSYSFGATVAVSLAAGGFGTPKDGARYDVTAQASVLTRGDVRVATPPAPVQLKGPGQLVMDGSFDVTSRDGMRHATKVTFGPGAFELNLSPQAGGYHLDRALLQGPMTVVG